MNDDWIGGFLDGEGSILAHITFPDGRYHAKDHPSFRILPIIHVSQSDRVILDKMRTYLGFGNVYRNWHRPDDCTRDNYGLRIEGWKWCKRFIDRIGPHSILKQKQIAILHKMHDVCKDSRQGRKFPPDKALTLIDLAMELRKLNRHNPQNTLDRLERCRSLAMSEIAKASVRRRAIGRPT